MVFTQQEDIGLRYGPTGRRITVMYGGEVVARSDRAMLLRESPRSIHYLFPKEDVSEGYLVESDHIHESGWRGRAVHWHVTVGEWTAENAAWEYIDLKDKRPDMRGCIGFDWKAMDAWYEEAEQIFVHPRDPWHRVDTVLSDRHIRVAIDGTAIAETNRAYCLFETGLPTRYYIPDEDVNTDFLTPTEKHTACPYKGTASYYSVKVGDALHENVVWYYPAPVPEQPKLAGTMCFYNEKADIYVDGVLEERPKTPWS